MDFIEHFHTSFKCELVNENRFKTLKMHMLSVLMQVKIYRLCGASDVKIYYLSPIK